MLSTTFSYNPFAREVSLLANPPVAGSLYRLVEVSGQPLVLSVGDSLGATATLRQDGVYKLVLQSIVMLGDVLTILEESEVVTHLELTGSVARESALYVQELCKENVDFTAVLCERYKRQKAVQAYETCNFVVAHNLLRGGCLC